MGACFNVLQFKGNINQVKAKWNSAVEDAIYECGHGGNYTGSISELGNGFQQINKVFDNYDEAHEYIEEHHQKWDGAMAVRYLAEGGLTKSSTNKKAKLEKKLTDAINYRDNLRAKLVNDLRNAKSTLIGCRNSGCLSKINRKFVTSKGTCPLCHQQLLSPTAQNRIAIADCKVAKAQKDLRNYKPTRSKSATTEMWLVGGWCSS